MSVNSWDFESLKQENWFKFSCSPPDPRSCKPSRRRFRRKRRPNEGSTRKIQISDSKRLRTRPSSAVLSSNHRRSVNVNYDSTNSKEFFASQSLVKKPRHTSTVKTVKQSESRCVDSSRCESATLNTALDELPISSVAPIQKNSTNASAPKGLTNVPAPPLQSWVSAECGGGGLSALRRSSPPAPPPSRKPSLKIFEHENEISTKEKRYFTRLTTAQRQAVQATFDRPLMIVASAGSGKTTTLTSRVAHALDTGAMRGCEVLALTFTRKAAEEMSNRIREVVGAASKEATVCNFHQFALKIMKENPRICSQALGGLLGVGGVDIVAGEEQRSILLEALRTWEKDQMTQQRHNIVGGGGAFINRDVEQAIRAAMSSTAEVYCESDDRISEFGDMQLHLAGTLSNDSNSRPSPVSTSSTGGSVSGRVSSGGKLGACMRLPSCTSRTSGGRLLHASARRAAIQRGGGKQRRKFDGNASNKSLNAIRAEVVNRSLKLISDIAALDTLEFGCDPRSVARPCDGKTAKQRRLDRSPELLRYLVTRYHILLMARGAVDLSDLIPTAVRMLRGSRKLLSQLRSKYRLIICDEFQDVSRPQWILLQMLATESNVRGDRFPHLTVCGDDDQSIYAWRGAINSFDRFKEHFKGGSGFETIMLDVNFRCSPQIVDAISGVISKNTQRVRKNIVSAAMDGPPVAIVPCHHQQHEAESIVRVLAQLTKSQNVMLKQIAILGRNRRVLRELELELKRLEIPTTLSIIGGKTHNYLSSGAVNDVLAIVRLACYLAFIRNTNECNLHKPKFSSKGDQTTNIRDGAGKNDERIFKRAERLRPLVTDVILLDDAFERVFRSTRGLGKTSWARLQEVREDLNTRRLKLDDHRQQESIPLIDAARELLQGKGGGGSSSLLRGLSEIDGTLDDFASEVAQQRLFSTLLLQIGASLFSEREGTGIGRQPGSEKRALSEHSIRLLREDALQFEAHWGRLQTPQTSSTQSSVLLPHLQARLHAALGVSFLDVVASMKQQGNGRDGKRRECDAVTLSTIHQAKGLEWDHVILVRFNEGEIPVKQKRRRDSQSEAQGELLEQFMEEERRLAFVAMSRARRSLTVSFIQEDSRKMVQMIPSRFIMDIPQNCQNAENSSVQNDDCQILKSSALLVADENSSEVERRRSEEHSL